jgi:hypothetical protein
MFYTVANLVACCYVPRQSCLSAVSVTYCHCFMFVFNGQISTNLSFIAKKGRMIYTSPFHITFLLTCLCRNLVMRHVPRPHAAT